jgi:hypothetical protein
MTAPLRSLLGHDSSTAFKRIRYVRALPSGGFVYRSICLVELFGCLGICGFHALTINQSDHPTDLKACSYIDKIHCLPKRNVQTTHVLPTQATIRTMPLPQKSRLLVVGAPPTIMTKAIPHTEAPLCFGGPPQFQPHNLLKCHSERYSTPHQVLLILQAHPAFSKTFETHTPTLPPHSEQRDKMSYNPHLQQL